MSVSKPKITTLYRLSSNVQKWGHNRPAYLVVHFTGGFSDSFGAMNKIYKSYLERGSNAHYLVGNNAVWQMVDPNTYYCTYSCGSAVGKKNVCIVPGWGPSTYTGAMSMSHAGIVGHSNSINVEICSCKTGHKRCNPMDDGWYFSDNTYSTAVKLCAWLCDEYSIKITNIVMHNQVTGKLCPAMWCNHTGAESGFEKFKRDVSYVLNDVLDGELISPNQEPEGGTINVPRGTYFYSRPDPFSPIVGQTTEDETIHYTVTKSGFYYTESGWVAV